MIPNTQFFLVNVMVVMLNLSVLPYNNLLLLYRKECEKTLELRKEIENLKTLLEDHDARSPIRSEVSFTDDIQKDEEEQH